MRFLILILCLFFVSCVADIEPPVVDIEPPEEDEIIGYVDAFGEETPVLKGDGTCTCDQSAVDDDCYYEYVSAVNACWTDRYDDDNVDNLFNGGIVSSYAAVDLYCGFDFPLEYLSAHSSVVTYGASTYSYVFVYASRWDYNGPAYSRGNCNFSGWSNCRIDYLDPTTSSPWVGLHITLPWQTGYTHGVHVFRLCLGGD